MNDITNLRNVLFETLDALRNKENPLDIERAKMINETAQTIINSAKVEVDFIRATGSAGATQFLSTPKPALEGKTEDGDSTKATTATATGIAKRDGNVTVHKMRG